MKYEGGSLDEEKEAGGKKHEVAKQRISCARDDQLPSDLYETLEEIARQKKVSLAWVVRAATEKYVEDKWPLANKVEGNEP